MERGEHVVLEFEVASPQAYHDDLLFCGESIEMVTAVVVLVLL